MAVCCHLAGHDRPRLIRNNDYHFHTSEHHLSHFWAHTGYVFSDAVYCLTSTQAVASQKCPHPEALHLDPSETGYPDSRQRQHTDEEFYRNVVARWFSGQRYFGGCAGPGRSSPATVVASNPTPLLDWGSRNPGTSPTSKPDNYNVQDQERPTTTVAIRQSVEATAPPPLQQYPTESAIKRAKRGRSY